MQALNDNGTWNLVQLPDEKKAIRCHWVFAIKFNPDDFFFFFFLIDKKQYNCV